MIGSEGPAEQRCSRASCRVSATSAIHWRNPRIHGVERVKTWLACDEHVEYLRDYLVARDFPVTVTPVGETVTRVG